MISIAGICRRSVVPRTRGDLVRFNWTENCSDARVRHFAAYVAAQGVERGEYELGDLVTAGYKENPEKVIVAAPGRRRFVATVSLERDQVNEALRRAFWSLVLVEHEVDMKRPWEAIEAGEGSLL